MSYDLNCIMMGGRMVKDPKRHSTKNGEIYTKFRIANNQGENETNFLNCTAYNKQAEFILRNCVQGDEVSIIGKFQSWTYQSPIDAKKLWAFGVQVREFKKHFKETSYVKEKGTERNDNEKMSELSGNDNIDS